MLLWIGLIFLVIWIVGSTVFHAGAFIHLALVIAVGIVAWHLVMVVGKRRQR